ncbi:hypothetical protein [uncultured Oscillibacter sp.]|uniref:hypothetical protein n=1 Tax=uncultured Oscillibacter sp. TaxID=876091 RepID=UPI00261BAFD8|nr:hypothetical protein [uncultured Oscillibacter sp.]
MKTNVTGIPALALALCLLLAACGGQGASPSEAPQEDLPPEETALVPSGFPELEETEWEAVSVDLESFGLSKGCDDERFMYIFEHTNTVPLDQLIVFDLWGDALTEGSSEELRSRFLEAPDTVLAYLVLMGDQIVTLPGWEPMPAAEIICQSIASADAAWHGGSEEFAQTLAACRERYSSGRVAELLDVMEQEHAASMERNHGQSQ